MSVCKYCGQKAGWFSDVHDSCATSCRQGCDQVVSLIASTIKDNAKLPTGHPDTQDWYSDLASQMWSELQKGVDKLATEHRIPPADLRKALLQGWSAGSQELATAVPLPTDKWAIMATL